MAKDPFSEGFEKGEPYGSATVDTIFDGISKQHSLGMKKGADMTRAQQATLQEFTGFFAAMISTLLFRAHRMIEKMLVSTGQEPGEADLWAQKVFTLFVQALQKEKVPVECKFIISRGKERKGG
jgi:hypothetical protein